MTIDAATTPKKIKIEKPQPPRGTYDLLGESFDQHNALKNRVEQIVRRYQYQGVTTPIFEHSSVFTKPLGDTSDIVGKEMYTFSDKGGESLTLRPEGTAAVMRAIISGGLTQTMPLKLFYHGPMFRYERPQAGRFRQHYQFGVEFLGVDHPFADVEVVHMAAHILKDLNILDKVTLEINTLGDQDSRVAYRAQLRHYYSAYENDLSQDSQRRLHTNPLRILDSKNADDQKINEGAPKLRDSLTDSAREYFDIVCQRLSDLNVPHVINQKLVRGLDYYNHTAFEFTTQHLGAQGTVLGGGRYNGLLASMGGSDAPGVGWAFGMERMLSLLNMPCATHPSLSVIAMHESYEGDAMILAQSLRCLGMSIDISYTGNAGKRMKRADKIGSSHAILLTEDAMPSGQYIVRNLKDGAQESIPHDDLISKLRGLQG